MLWTEANLSDYDAWQINDFPWQIHWTPQLVVWIVNHVIFAIINEKESRMSLPLPGGRVGCHQSVRRYGRFYVPEYRTLACGENCSRRSVLMPIVTLTAVFCIFRDFFFVMDIVLPMVNIQWDLTKRTCYFKHSETRPPTKKILCLTQKRLCWKRPSTVVLKKTTHFWDQLNVSYRTDYVMPFEHEVTLRRTVPPCKFLLQTSRPETKIS